MSHHVYCHGHREARQSQQEISTPAITGLVRQAT